MKVLIACEESQRVCAEFRKLGHEAYSCDIQECSGGHPEWHIMQDVLPLLNGNCKFTTMDGSEHEVTDRWDMIIAFPPCTYLTVTGNRWFNVEKYGEKAIQRGKDREKAIEFFMSFANADCDKIVIENPIGVMSTRYRKPDQIIHPYMFGDAEKKATCLWLKGLPKLQETKLVVPAVITYKNGTGTDSRWHMETLGLPKEERAKIRSKTFSGIARAMAEQWGRCAKRRINMEAERLKNILELHEKWLKGEKDGERADLSGANLVNAEYLRAQQEQQAAERMDQREGQAAVKGTTAYRKK